MELYRPPALQPREKKPHPHMLTWGSSTTVWGAQPPVIAKAAPEQDVFGKTTIHPGFPEKGHLGKPPVTSVFQKRGFSRRCYSPQPLPGWDSQQQHSNKGASTTFSRSLHRHVLVREIFKAAFVSSIPFLQFPS